MNKKFLLTILILFFIFVAALYWYFNDLSFKVPSSETSEQKIQKEGGKNFQTIELEKPPFIKN